MVGEYSMATMKKDKKLDGYKRRLSTFTNWPKSMGQTPHELAMSGFCYEGRGDITWAPCCRLLVRDWELHDVVACEHYNHSPHCSKAKEGHVQCPSKRSPCPQRMRRWATEGDLSIYGGEVKPPAQKKTSHICVVCDEGEISLVLLPCGHAVMCKECSTKITRYCPICRKGIDSVHCIFLP